MNRLLNILRKEGTVRGLQVFQLFRFGGFFLIGILLAKGPVSISDIGVYESLMFLSGAFSFFWISGFLNGLLMRYPKEKKEAQGIYLFNVSLQIIAFNLLLVLLLFLFKNGIIHLLPPSGEHFFGLLLVYVLINNPTFIVEYIFLLKERPVSLMVYGVLGFLANVISVIIPIYSGYGIEAIFVNLIIVASLKLCFLLFLLTKNSESRLDFSVWTSHFYFSIPLIFSILISGSAEYIDGLLVSSHFGADAFAIFRYGAKELPISLLMANALSAAIVPQFSGKGGLPSGLEKLKGESGKLMHILFPITILLLMSSNWIYPMVFREEFRGSAGIFNIYLLLIISRMVFPQSIMMALGKTSVIFKVAIIEISVNIAASYLLMLKFGIAGVAFGTLIAFFTEKALLMWYLQKNENIQPGSYCKIKWWSFYSFILLLSWLFVNNFNQ